MTLSLELWQANQDLAHACLEHPFIQEIGTGTLPKAIFTYYLGQDVFFLNAFARAYSLAAVKAPDMTAFEVFHTLVDGVLKELRLHQGYAAEWRVDLKAIELGDATRRYTDFLSSIAWNGDIGSIAVAMTPCMRLYSFLGKRLAERDELEHLYTEWIQTYSSPAFDELAYQLEALVDQYAIDTPSIRSTYRYAMVCEREFFQAAWNSQNAKPRN